MARHRLYLLVLVAMLVGCGAKSQLIVRGSVETSDVLDVVDAADVRRDVPPDRDVLTERDSFDGCVPVQDRCVAAEICGNGADDNCDGHVDENCGCAPGAVQDCFRGPPGRRNIGPCRDGSQTCEMTGTWGECLGGIPPRLDVCNGQDNLCNGCSQQSDCPIMCPGPNDPRVPDTAPFQNYALRGEDFYMGAAQSWNWHIEGGPCDALSATPSFELHSPNSMDGTFFPRLSGDYTVTLTVTTAMGTTLSCTWIVHVEGPGLRVEMCYPENTVNDLDLFVHKPGSTLDWYPQGADAQNPFLDSCGWFACEALIRGTDASGLPDPRTDWGYANSPLMNCVNGPHGPDWSTLGFCANPRLDVDNNLQEGTGLPENINIDRPREGETFRVMVQNWSGTLSRPLVNIYCSGRRVATYGGASPPDEVPNFRGRRGDMGVGAMWRVVDVTTHVDAMGTTTTCDTQALHRPGMTTGYDVTFDDPRF